MRVGQFDWTDFMDYISKKPISWTKPYKLFCNTGFFHSHIKLKYFMHVYLYMTQSIVFVKDKLVQVASSSSFKFSAAGNKDDNI